MMFQLAIKYDGHNISYPCLAEKKIDGARCQIYTRGDIWRARSRQGTDWTAKLELIGRRLTALARGYSADAERGITWDMELSAGSRGKTSGALKRGGASAVVGSELHARLFDAFFCDGELWGDSASQLDRSASLKRAMYPDGMLSIIRPATINSEDDLIAYYLVCLSVGYEGIVAKDPEAGYCAGRTGAWVKLKPNNPILKGV